MEDLRALNSICQKKDYKTKGNWMARNITRPMALPVSWLLLHTGITANQVTLISLLVGICGCLFFAVGTKSAMITGSLFLQLWYLLDHVDGHIARYRKQSSLTGVYFDYITHYIIHAGIFIGIGYGAANLYEDVRFTVFGYIAGISVVFFYLVYDVLYKTYYSCIVKKSEFTVKKPNTDGSDKSAKAPASFPRKIFSFAHKICEVHVIMNIITILALLSFFVKLYVWGWLILFYGVLILCLALAKNVYFIAGKIPDKLFNDTFMDGTD